MSFLPATFHLEKKVGEGLGHGQILLKPLQDQRVERVRKSVKSYGKSKKYCFSMRTYCFSIISVLYVSRWQKPKRVASPTNGSNKKDKNNASDFLPSHHHPCPFRRASLYGTKHVSGIRQRSAYRANLFQCEERHPGPPPGTGSPS